MKPGNETSLGISNGVEMFSTPISHNELHARFVRTSDNRTVFRSITKNGVTNVTYYDPDFWTIELNGVVVEDVLDIENPARILATLDDRRIKIVTS